MTHLYNKLWLQINLGNSREGKTWCNLVEGEILDPRFDITRVAFTPKEFLDIIDDIRYKGQVVVMSEMGIALSARRWHSISNILFNEVLQTTGYLNPIALFDVPDFSFVDKQARKIINALCIARRRKNNPAKLWVYLIYHDRKYGKDYFVHPRTYIDDERVAIRSIIFNRRPSAQLLKDFKRKEEDYKGKIRKSHRRIMGLMQSPEHEPRDTMADELREIHDNIDGFKNVRGKIDAGLIQVKMGVSFRRAAQLKTLVEKSVDQKTHETQ